MNKKINISLTSICIVLISTMLILKESYAAMNGQNATTSASVQILSCNNINIVCAKTATVAFAPNGDLWRLWAQDSSLYFQISEDNGTHFSNVKRVDIDQEEISARNESRPKIAFDKFQGVYLSWTTPKEEKYTADVRFTYSSDYGKTFTQPVTVNNDNLVTGHRFNELAVTDEGDISIVWLDSRLLYQLRLEGKPTNGSALYLGKANYRKNDTVFTNEQLANNTCVCCRLAIEYNAQGELAVFWRHIYGDNIREFALLTITQGEDAQKLPYQISYDHWKINGCPHQGGGISVDETNRYHMVWFNQGDAGKGIFYASSTDQGKSLSKPISVGDQTAQAAHPHVMSNGNVVDIVWTQFTGTEHQLWHQQSTDHGKTFANAQLLGTAADGSDRPFIIKKDNKSYVSWLRAKHSHLVKVL